MPGSDESSCMFCCTTLHASDNSVYLSVRLDLDTGKEST